MVDTNEYQLFAHYKQTKRFYAIAGNAKLQEDIWLLM